MMARLTPYIAAMTQDEKDYFKVLESVRAQAGTQANT